MNASSISSSDNQVWRATSLLSVLNEQITHSNELTTGTIGAYHACEWVMAQTCTSRSTNKNKSDLRYPPRSRLCASDRDQTWALTHLRRLLQPDPEKMRLEIVIGMEIEIHGCQSSSLFSNEPLEKTPVMTIEDFHFHFDDHFEIHLFGYGLYYCDRKCFRVPKTRALVKKSSL